MKRQLKVAIPFVVVGYLLLCLTVYCFQGYAIFRSNDIYFAPPANLAVDEVFIPTPDGEKLFAWWMHSDAAEKTILFFQGNGLNISYQGDRLKTFQAMDANALFVDYRGYGRSTGRIRAERDIYVDGAAAWNFLVKEKRIAPEKITIWGRSLGGAVATETALHQRAAALVLESAFYSMDEMARRKYWYPADPAAAQIPLCQRSQTGAGATSDHHPSQRRRRLYPLFPGHPASRRRQRAQDPDPDTRITHRLLRTQRK